MKVTELTAYVVRVPLKKRVKHASHTRTETDNVLVRARLDDRSVGWGEGVPREYVTGESADSALDLLKTSDLKGQLGDCRDFIGALRMVERLKLAGIASVEQPVRHEEVDRLADIRKRVKTPIMLDESLCGMADAERAAAGGLCDLFNLRLSKCGGFIPALRLVEFAARHGLGYQLGCQVGETAVLSAAGRHFATSVKGLWAVEGSFDRH